jgi:hypothetical protein
VTGAREARWLCSDCEAVSLDSALRTSPHPFQTQEILSGCPLCGNIDLRPACDELECLRAAACGWPSPAGYRVTCGAHYAGRASNRGTTA